VKQNAILRHFNLKGLSFLGSLIHTGNEISMERWDRDDRRECRRWSARSVKPTLVCVGFRSDLARSSGFPAETHARHLSLAGYRERSGRNTMYSGRLSLPLSFSIAGRCAWVTDLSSSLSFSVVLRISLPFSFFVAGRRLNSSNI
jgi:hypothetical protein